MNRAKLLLSLLFLTNAFMAKSEEMSIDSLKSYAAKNWRNDPQKCLDYTYQVGSRAQATNDSFNLVWSYNFRGIIYGFTGNFDSSFHYYNRSLKLSREYGIEEYEVKSTMNLAINHQMLGNYQKSLDYFFGVLKIFEENNDSTGIAHACGGMGNNFLKLGEAEKAERYYLRSIAVYEAMGAAIMTAPIYSNLGVLYRDQGRREEALNVFLKAIPLLEQTKQYVSLAPAYVNIAGLYHRSDKDTSEAYYSKAINICKRLEKNDVLGLAYIGMGQLNIIYEQYAEAVKWLKKAAVIPEADQDLDQRYDIYHRLTQAYEKLGQPDSALVYFRKESAIKDSISGMEVKKSIAQLEIDYETAKKEKQIAEQQVTIAEGEARVQRRNAQLIGLGGGILALFLVGGLIYTRQKGRQKQLRQQLELEKVESLNKVQQEKLRISRDLHDNIGSQLTFVISSLDNMNYISEEEKRKQKLSQLGEFTKNTMNELREAIWAIKSEQLTQEELASKIAEFIDRAKAACPQTQFDIRQNFHQPKALNSNQAINLFRAVQEGVNNAIKYADAEHISVTLNDDTITVTDDGKGFDKNTVTMGNGLGNIAARMKEVGFQVNIDSAAGKGTSISIVL